MSRRPKDYHLLKTEIYTDPLTEKVPQPVCSACFRRTGNTVKLINGLISEGYTKQEAYDKLKLRICCRSTVSSPFVIPVADQLYDPEKMSGKKSGPKVTKYHGNMKIVNAKVMRKDASITRDDFSIYEEVIQEDELYSNLEQKEKIYRAATEEVLGEYVEKFEHYQRILDDYNANKEYTFKDARRMARYFLTSNRNKDLQEYRSEMRDKYRTYKRLLRSEKQKLRALKRPSIEESFEDYGKNSTALKRYHAEREEILQTIENITKDFNEDAKEDLPEYLRLIEEANPQSFERDVSYEIEGDNVKRDAVYTNVKDLPYPKKVYTYEGLKLAAEKLLLEYGKYKDLVEYKKEFLDYKKGMELSLFSARKEFEDAGAAMKESTSMYSKRYTYAAFDDDEKYILSKFTPPLIYDEKRRDTLPYQQKVVKYLEVNTDSVDRNIKLTKEDYLKNRSGTSRLLVPKITTYVEGRKVVR